MTTLINFANQGFEKSQKQNSISATKVGGIENIINYSLKDIDKEFAKNNRKILRHNRGAGYWLWKPYFIYQTLLNLKEGDYLFYCDSGAYFIKSVLPLIEDFNECNGFLMSFELPFIEQHWTKRDLFVHMNCDTSKFTETPQRLASFSIWKVSPESCQFALEWLQLAQNAQLLTDTRNKYGMPNYDGFQEHRHDQSIFSLLCKKYNQPPFRDPSGFGNKKVQEYPHCKYPQIIEHNRKKEANIWNKVKSKFSFYNRKAKKAIGIYE